MIKNVRNLNLPIHEIQILEREFQCTISRNPMNGWWYIATPDEADMPYINSWIQAFKAGQWPTATRANPYTL